MAAWPKWEPRRFTAHEYRRIEQSAEAKSEFLEGFLYAMAVGTRRHNRIATNVVGMLFAQLLDRPCEVYGSDMRVAVRPDAQFYPDVSVVCGDNRFPDGSEDAITNPILIVEVPSPSTETRDREDKFEIYREIEMFADYLLISQERPEIEHRHRQETGEWISSTISRRDETVQIPSIGCALRLSDVYARITFDA
jgi:Uma2 family endonuclease